MIRRRHDPNLHRPEDSVCGGHSLFHVIPVTGGMGNRRRLAEAGYEVGGDRPEPALTEVRPHGSLAVCRRATGRAKDGKTVRTESYCRGYVSVLLACGMELTAWRGGYFCDLYDSFFEEDR